MIKIFIKKSANLGEALVEKAERRYMLRMKKTKRRTPRINADL